VLALLGLIMLLGCHTVQGLGKDIESGGKALERAGGGGKQ